MDGGIYYEQWLNEDVRLLQLISNPFELSSKNQCFIRYEFNSIIWNRNEAR